MNRLISPATFLIALLGSGTVGSADAQVADSISARMRPLGSGSAVDKYVPQRSPQYRETAFQNQGIPAADVTLTQFEAPQLPPNATTAPSVVVTPGTGGFPPPSPVTTTPRTLPSGQGVPAPVPMQGVPVPSGVSVPTRGVPVPSSSDLSPVVRPQIGGGGFATIDNCSNISPPSSYSAAVGNGCATPVAYEYDTTYAAPAAVAAPVVVPAAYTPPKPLFSFGQDRNPVVVGQGLVGQPVAYVPGQRIRNFVRYLFP